MNTEEKKVRFAELLEVIDELREKCPWDREQTFESLRNLTIEETYELADAILKGDMDELKEELGDVLLHIVFYAKMAEEKNAFDIGEVMEKLISKLKFRHPHIYGSVKVKDEAEVKKNWEKLKLKEGKKSVLSGVPVALPALIKAQRLQEKTAQVGFEWSETADVVAKIEEELGEFITAFRQQKENPEALEEEFGDLLFSLVNLSRYMDIDPETALEKTNLKFKSRFEFIEENALHPLTEMSLEAMDALWEKAKMHEGKQGQQVRS